MRAGAGLQRRAKRKEKRSCKNGGNRIPAIPRQGSVGRLRRGGTEFWTIETRGTDARYNVNGKNANRPTDRPTDQPTAVRRGARNFCHDKNQWNKPLPPASVHGKTANRDTEADLLSLDARVSLLLALNCTTVVVVSSFSKE